MSLFYPASEQVYRGKTSEREDRFTARFVELTPPTRIVQAISFDSADPAFSGEMTTVATFEERNGGTEVTIVYQHLPRAYDLRITLRLALGRHLRSWLAISSRNAQFLWAPKSDIERDPRLVPQGEVLVEFS